MFYKLAGKLHHSKESNDAARIGTHTTVRGSQFGINDPHHSVKDTCLYKPDNVMKKYGKLITFRTLGTTFTIYCNWIVTSRSEA